MISNGNVEHALQELVILISFLVAQTAKYEEENARVIRTV